MRYTYTPYFHPNSAAKAERRRRAGKESNHQKRRRMAREAQLQRARAREAAIKRSQDLYDVHVQARLRRELGRLGAGLARLEELGDVEG